MPVIPKNIASTEGIYFGLNKVPPPFLPLPLDGKNGDCKLPNGMPTGGGGGGVVSRFTLLTGLVRIIGSISWIGLIS